MYIRLALALIVMQGHLVYKSSSPAAGLAMMSFYVLSGYGITRSGVRSGFWLSRLMRLYPAYLISIFATATALWFGWIPHKPFIGLPQTYWDWLCHLLMIVPTWPHLSLSPAAWMLKWMILGYLVLWLGAAKTPQRAGLFLLATMAATVWFLVHSQSVGAWYQSMLCALLAFAVGATVAHLGVEIPKDRAWSAELSYPVFLLHYPVGAVFPMLPGWPLFFAALAPTLALSWLLLVVVERPVQTFRQQLRANHGN
jgi:peptidoglycan/LPS O-acetylase OafA/YrhL